MPTAKPDPNFPKLPNEPFRIDRPPIGRSADQVLISPIHAYYHNIEQINGGRNDMFAAVSNVGGWTMGYFDGSKHEAVAVGEGTTRLPTISSWAPSAAPTSTTSG